ncbi:hypothetical protein [Haloarcula laminariae]|uniref:hypothetical protein n=1 Tax=Haloarcula laminariae TaxID=2961577 RepID=UPI0021CA606C|nr:hypothetical protein [Halomicroarcula laminariae]
MNLAERLVAMPTAKQSFEFEGDRALETAKTILSNYEIQGSVKRISVELVEEQEVQDEGNEKSADPTDDRELKQIRANTNHHIVLTGLKELDEADKTPASSNDIYNHKSDQIKEESVYAALSNLYDRRLVERERIKEGSNHHYVYSMNGYGQEELNRVGIHD